MTLDDIMKNSCTDRKEKIYTDHYEKKPDLEWDCPEHYIPQDKPIVPKHYKVVTLSHKQNEPIKKVEERGKLTRRN